MIIAYKEVLPKIHSQAFVEKSAQIIGDVELGAESSVWFNALIRGDVNYIRIGERTNIQDACLLHVVLKKYPTIIGAEVTIGHGAIVHGARVGDNCLIGMGSIVLDGAEIGDHSMVGAGSVVPPGMKVSPHTLVMGIPAREVRMVSESNLEMMKNQVAEYLKLAREYAARNS